MVSGVFAACGSSEHADAPSGRAGKAGSSGSAGVGGTAGSTSSTGGANSRAGTASGGGSSTESNGGLSSGASGGMKTSSAGESGEAGTPSNAGESGTAANGGEGGATLACLGNSGVWQPTVATVSNVQYAYPSLPRAGVDKAGDVFVVWDGSIGDANYHAVWASRRAAGASSFDQPVMLTNPNFSAIGDQPTPHSLAVSADGSALAVWAGHDGPGVYASHYSLAQGWEPETEEDQAAVAVIASGDPQVVMDTHGNGLLVWVENDATPPDYDAETYVRSYAPDTGWSDVTRLSTYGAAIPGSSDTVESIDGPSIAMNASGDAVVVWEVTFATSTAGAFQAIRYDASTRQWGTPSFIDVCTDCVGVNVNPSFPSVALAENGDAFVVWTQAPEPQTNARTWAATSAAGSNDWSDKVALSPEVSFDPNHSNNTFLARVFADPAGGAIATWMTNDSLVSSRYRGGVWQGDQTVGPGGENRYDEHIVFDGAGTASCVWMSAGPEQQSVAVATLGASDSTWTLGAPPPITYGFADPQPVFVHDDCAGPLVVFIDGTGLGPSGVYAASQR
jgi:hypothetical protein